MVRASALIVANVICGCLRIGHRQSSFWQHRSSGCR